MRDTAEVDYVPRAGQAVRPEGPLTVEVMNAINSAQDTAAEIRSRLYNLRERLYGSPPQEASAPEGKTQSPHFKGEHHDRSRLLLATLADIDSISADLNNRL